MLVSSHLLAEVAQTVDDVVIIANGRLVTQSSLADLATALAGRRARAHTARRGAAGRARRRRASPQSSSPDDVSWPSRPPTDAVGLAAAGAGAVIYEMTAEHFDLEELFLELTDPEGAIR